MIQIEKNKVLAEYLNIDFDKLDFSQKMDFGDDWNNIMKIIIQLKVDCKNLSFYQGFEITTNIEEMISDCIYLIKKLENE